MEGIGMGHPPGVVVGEQFSATRKLVEAGVRRKAGMGVDGNEEEGAESLLLFSCRPSDEDHGAVILCSLREPQPLGLDWTYAWGDSPKGMNAVLARSVQVGSPVRVIRSAWHCSSHRPDRGYRYDGHFCVTDYWRERASVDYNYRWRFRLEGIPGESYPENSESQHPGHEGEPVSSFARRVDYDSVEGRRVKDLHGSTCQICGERVASEEGPYAEAVHIRPLSYPHLGPDSSDNILCLCPKHRAQFERGAIAVRDNGDLLGGKGQLRMVEGHILGQDHLLYHRQHIADAGVMNLRVGDVSIPSHELRLDDVPPTDASLSAMHRFALSFDGYGMWPDPVKRNRVENEDSLDGLRLRLFIEQRRGRWHGDGLGEEFARSTVAKIREKLGAKASNE